MEADDECPVPSDWAEEAKVQGKCFAADSRCQQLNKKLLQKKHLHSKLQLQSKAEQMLPGEVVLSQ